MNDIYLFDEYKNKVLTPTKKELEKNSRSRSAKLSSQQEAKINLNIRKIL